ncbi:SRPBCC domain-containing protein [Mycetocola zhadangensis]|uniref:SRPBCC domain-containing protein n=2 Tax=Mycetocola zhadangensis TaxID=1164595 RepID=A0A3L7J7W2_9MICO|nr:SRPBCC domain-containing protein [Mycetocola zhadangensis]
MSNSQPTFDVHATRTFPVSVEAVFAAWTEGDLVKQWWGPLGFTCPMAEMDVRSGGVSVVAMRAPAEFGGAVMYNTWTYTKVDPPNRLEYDMRFSTPEGQPISPASAGIPGGVPDFVPHVVLFDRLDDHRSRVSVTESGYTAHDARAMSLAGLEECLDKLAVLLGTGSTANT